MAALFPVLQRTLNIDQALLEIYGMDQFGIDSAWREFLGLEPLPSPEELKSQLKEQAEASQGEVAEGEGSDEQGSQREGSTQDSAPAIGAGSTPESTPDADAHPAGATGEEGQESGGASPSPSTSPGCNVPAAGGSPAGLGMLLLLGAPLGLMALPRLRRRWPFR